MSILPVAALLALCVVVHDCALLDAAQEKQLNIYKDRVAVVHGLLEKECPSYRQVKRQIAISKHPVHLDIEKQLYLELFKKLIECRQKKAAPTPAECQTAETIRESWRLEHNHLEYSPGGPHSDDNGYACDFHANNTKWFRFAGVSGNRILNTCPQYKSCGTRYAYWTDEPMPQEIGVVATVTLHSTDSYYVSSCKYHNTKILVMRCSWKTPYDFIYKLAKTYTQDSCSAAICGMV